MQRLFSRALSTSMITPQLGIFKLPEVKNEPMKTCAPGSAERKALTAALGEARSQAYEVPCIVNGEKVYTDRVASQEVSCDHKVNLCKYHEADTALVQKVSPTTCLCFPA